MRDDFCHLHVHSCYSLLDGFGFPSAFAQRAKELGQTALAITDHGNVSAHKRWYDACRDQGIKPILGVEAYVVDNCLTKGVRKPWHITLLAKNAAGYHNLLKIVTASWEKGFYYKPRTDWETLKVHSEGIVATSGCPSGKIGRSVAKEGWDEARVIQELRKQAGIFKDYYVEVSPWAYEDGIKIATAVYKASRKEGLPLVLTMDAHYPQPEDAHKQDVMLCIQNNAKFNDPKRMKFSQQDFCLWSGNDMASKWAKLHGTRLPGLDEMITNTRKIADEVDFTFPTASLLTFPHKGDRTKLLRKWCEEGLKRRKLDKNKEYRKRLEYEFELVVSKNFVDYFLIVTDVIVWAKDSGILVGAARGSSCGSLMCYLLRITEIDPLIHGLMMERFIDVSRKDLPDIDIDFEAERRDEVKRYMSEKYGTDKVASLATFGTFKGKMCLQDIGRVFSDKIPQQAVEECKRLVVQRSGADSRAGFTMEDTFTNFEQAAGHLKRYPELGLAIPLEGQVRHLGMHAAGVVVSNESIDHFAATYVTSKGERVISMDYHDATSVGLLKIDVLGLSVLTVAKRAMEQIKKNHGKEIDLFSLSLDDKEVFKNFARGWVYGIFQFEGASTRQVCRQVHPDNFVQLTAVNALSRPGPLHSGGTTNYVERRNGKQAVVPLHPMLEHITKDTYGITIYQEQVMRIVREMGKFDWSGIATVRKMMSKKYGDEAFGKMQDQFVAGAKLNGVTTDEAISVWKNICTFGSWAFNCSHSVAYSTMAYQMMWLKTHYPAEFYAAAISCEEDVEKQQRLIREYSRAGLKPLPVSINDSAVVATSNKKGLRLGLNAVVGLGDKSCEKLMKNRPYKSYSDFTRRSGMGGAKAEVLLKIGAFRDLNFKFLSEQADLFDVGKSVSEKLDYRNPRDEDLRRHCPTMSENKLCEEYRAWLGGHVDSKVTQIQDIDDITEKTELLILGCTNPSADFNQKNKIQEANSRGGEYVPRAGEEGLTRERLNFLNANITDETESIIVRVGYKIYPRYKEMLWALTANDVVGVRGSVLGEMRMVFAFNVVNLTKLRSKLKNKSILTEQETNFINPPARRTYR
jgi:DNA polymerase-3 subunit alpha